MLLVGIIGFEREYQGHNAGLRTHLLVGLGSCIVMILSIYSIGYSSSGNMETMRLAAQVVSGIGFLGAGVIIQTGTTVKGLTTAATLWFSMSIGLACGSGNLLIALTGAILGILCLIAFIPIEKFATKKNPIVVILLPVDKSVYKEVADIAERNNVIIRNTDVSIATFHNEVVLRLLVRLGKTSSDKLNNYIRDLCEEIYPLSIHVY
ncbi:MAG: MgtC/SapB family protein [Firmicutes bacterium]|nr:MgtC/SapB family protein [Candidatus Alectryobacillus merdavium]